LAQRSQVNLYIVLWF